MAVKIIFILNFCFLTIVLQAQQLAFPGATGFGRYASGGRGGSVYHVTNLNDKGAGSFRDAISQPNRIVVFDVAGIINIESRLVFFKNLTISGQTAPGEGVVVYGDGVSFSGADNMICRYMRFRMGAGGTSGKDAAGIANGQNMIFDHVSVTWGRDETFSISWDNKGTEPANITIQNSIIGQGLQTHSAGGLIQTSGGVTLFRNLYIDNHTRNPKVKGLNQFVNNVVYNWGGGGCYILGDSEGTSWATIVNNYFIEGPSSAVSTYSRANNNFQLYAKGNVEDANRDGVLNGILSEKSNYGPAFWVSDPTYWANVAPTDINKIPQMHPDIPEMTSAEEAYYWIIDNVGCSLPARDQVDHFLIDELTSLGKKGETISTEKGLPTGGPGLIFNGEKLPDSDNDGMPDDWEDANGTDKKVNDINIIGSDGYSNIEKYINSINKPMAFVKNPVGISTKAKTTNTITITWSNLQDDYTSIVIEYGTNENFSNSKTVEGNLTSSVIEGLKSNTKYFFRLKSTKGQLESGYSEVYSMATNGAVIPPLSCENPYPENGEIIDKNRNIELRWENRTGIMAGALNFDIYLGTNENNMELVASGKTSYSFVIDELEKNKTYYWRVKTTNLLGVDDGSVWSFSTGEPILRNKILHLSFDENFGSLTTDSLRNVQASAVSFTPDWTKGMVSNSVLFPGIPVNSYMKVGYYNELLLDNQSFTFSFWFKSPGGLPDTYLFHKGMHDLTNGGNGKWIGLQYRNSTLTFGIDDNSKKTTCDLGNAGKWFDNEWHHIACVRDVDNKVLQMYIDGGKEKEVTDGTVAIGSNSDLILGNRNGYFDNPYSGNIDEFIIYDAALSGEEIYDIFTYVPSEIIDTTHNVDPVDTTEVGKNLVQIDSEIRFVPNPFKEKLAIDLSQFDFNDFVLEIVDTNGKRVYFSNRMNGNENIIHIDGLEYLPKGVYFGILTNRKRYLVQRIIKL